MTFENVLEKIRDMRLQLSGINEETNLDYIFAKSDLDEFLEWVNSRLEKASEAQREYAIERINQVLYEANVFYAKPAVKNKSAIMIKIEDEDVRKKGILKILI